MSKQRGIKLLTKPQPEQTQEIGHNIKSAFGGQISHCDPFLLLDHIGPVYHKPGEAAGMPGHPHRGFETVTYLIDGCIQHKDSAGKSGELKEGWVLWMTAGSGVLHAEMPGDDMVDVLRDFNSG